MSFNSGIAFIKSEFITYQPQDPTVFSDRSIQF